MAPTRYKSCVGPTLNGYMSAGRHLVATAAALMLLLEYGAAQTNPATAATRSGKVIVPDRPTAVDANVSSPVLSRPDRPERPGPSPEVRSRLERFKLDARAYLNQQETLKKRMYGANEQERSVLRQQLRELRETWLERARELRQEYRDEKVRLERRLPGHKELFDDLRDEVNDDLKPGTRPRRGTD